MKPNIAMNPPPESLEISGGIFCIRTDFRIWIQACELLQNLKSTSDEIFVKQLAELYELIFINEYPTDAPAALKAITAFLQGYPEQMTGKVQNGTQTLSLCEDINEIVLAIRNQSGLDLSYRCKYFHFWEFLLEVKTLEERHYISRIQQIRGYKGKDKDMLRLKEQYALNSQPSENELIAAEELDELFYDS